MTRRLFDLAFRFLAFAILGLSPWWLAWEIIYAR